MLCFRVAWFDLAMAAHNDHKPHVYLVQDSSISGPLRSMAAVTHPPDDVINVPDHFTNHCHANGVACLYETRQLCMGYDLSSVARLLWV